MQLRVVGDLLVSLEHRRLHFVVYRDGNCCKKTKDRVLVVQTQRRMLRNLAPNITLPPPPQKSISFIPTTDCLAITCVGIDTNLIIQLKIMGR